MEEKERLILDFMKSEIYLPMKAKEMASMLSVPKKEYNAFLEILNKLEEEYKIQKNRKGKYNVVAGGKYLAGIFRRKWKRLWFRKNRKKRRRNLHFKKQYKRCIKWGQSFNWNNRHK